jgi:hypothetical protein
VSDAGLRKQLQHKGLIRAAEFPWSKTASRVHELLAAVERTFDSKIA